MRTVDQWLNETETSYLCTDTESAADLAVYHQIKQIMTFADIQIDEAEFSRLNEWFQWIEEKWSGNQLKGRPEFEKIVERLQGQVQSEAATP